ncbi:hypothetical protein A2635_05450 [Candidatus Peribacteria bacterium RIFCSPHIGHO2_01_FULL_51_9]|nr:MAG: hypothetical protein A2635_05450 [Candidatus Peribacteria bacterium RIFCSPHIGHO2_01_FULL_51_9]
MSISPDRILYLDDALLAVNKRSGELVVRGAGEVGKLPLLDFLKKDYPGLQTLHRLDFETSGVVLFARSSAVAKQVLASKFDGWKKIYQTLIMGRVKKRGVIDMPLSARRNPRHMQHAKQAEMVHAVTKYEMLEECGDVSYIEAEIETGRHHQIRKHFAAIGHPLVLDEVYGDKKFNRWFVREFGYRKFFLHARRVELPHPVTKERIIIEAPLPHVFEECLKKIRG